MEETEAAITETLETGHPVELPPANAYIRRLQHQMAERYNLGVSSATIRTPPSRLCTVARGSRRTGSAAQSLASG